MGRDELKASVVIPTLNGGVEFEKCLEMIYKQKTSYPFEVIVIDSGSNDGTVEIVRRFPLRLYLINKKDFNHGLTRQWGLELAEGDYVAFLSQDAIPADENWLESLVENFEDEKVAGAYSRQLVKPDRDPIARKYVEAWITASKYKKISYIKSRAEYEALSPWSKRLFVNFDNVSSCVRKSLMKKFPYSKLNFGEDLEWSKRVIEGGYKIVYEPRSQVYHSHKTSIVGNYKRALVDNKMMKEVLGVDLFAEMCNSSKKFLIRCTINSIKEHIEIIKKSDLKPLDKLKWMIYATTAEIAKNYGMLKGIALASVKTESQRNLKIVQVVHDFLPYNYGGTEIYTYNLAKKLSEKNEICIFYRKGDKTAPEYQVKRSFYNGLPVTSINNNIYDKPNHLMIYENSFIDKAFEDFLNEVKPDVIHFLHLHGLSIGIISTAKRLGIPTVFTLADYWFMCPRGQMMNYKWELCSEVIEEKCARCVFESSEPITALEKCEGNYKFIDLVPTMNNPVLAKALIKAPGSNFVAKNEFTIDGINKYVLFEHPTSEVRYRVHLPRKSRLEFGLAMHPNTWKESGEGVVFEIYVEASGYKEIIFSYYIDPKHNVQDRRWHDFSVDLSKFGEETVDLIFLTSPGPEGNIAFCDAGWGDLKIEVEEADDENYGVINLRKKGEIIKKLVSKSWAIIAKSSNDPRILIEAARKACLLILGDKARIRQINKRNRDILQALEQIDLIISPSQFLREKYIAFGVKPKKIIFSDYGMNTKVFKKPISIKKTTGRIVFGFAGMLIPTKGVHFLVDAFVRVPEEKAELRIYGHISEHSPDYFDMLKRKAGGKNNIKFMGEYYVEEAPEIFSQLDVLVVPSIWHENSPLTIHEAFMAGVPVITSNIGGMAELVKHNINGLLFKVGDSEDLYQTIMRVIGNPELISQLSAYVMSVKSIEENAEELEKIYKDLIVESRK